MEFNNHIVVFMENQRDFTCPFPDCGKRYSSKRSLTSHTLIHKRERQQIPSSSFPSSNLTQDLPRAPHRLSGGRSFMCPLPGCGKTFEHVEKLGPHYKHRHEEKATKKNVLAQPGDLQKQFIQKRLGLTKANSGEDIFCPPEKFPYPNFFCTRDLPLPVQIATNAEAMADLKYPRSQPVELKELSEPFPGTYSSSLWLHQDIDI